MALPRGGVPEGVSLLGAATCPGWPPMWAEGCAGGVFHSPAEGFAPGRMWRVREPLLRGVARRSMVFGHRWLLQKPPRHGNSLQKGLSGALPFRAVPGPAKCI